MSATTDKTSKSGDAYGPYGYSGNYGYGQGEGYGGLENLGNLIGLGDIWTIILERFWILAICAIASILLVYAYVEKLPKIYQSMSTVFIPSEKNVVNIQDVEAENLRAFNTMQNIIEMLKSKPLLVETAKKLKLHENPSFFGEGYNKSFSYTPEHTVSMLSGMVKGSLRTNTNYIDIFVEHQDPLIAKIVADEVAEQLVNKMKKDRMDPADAAVVFLKDQSEKVKKDLMHIEKKIQEFREKYRVASLENSEIENLNEKFNEIRKNRQFYETILKEIDKIGPNPDKLLGLELIAQDSTVSTLRTSIDRKHEIIASMSEKFTEQHPKMIQERRELNSLNHSLRNAIIEATKKIKPRYESLQAQENDLEKTVLGRSSEAMQWRTLERELESNRNLYKTLLTRIKETDVTKNIDFDPMSIFQKAYLPGAPIKPEKTKYYLAGTMGGIIIGFALAFVLHSLDNTVKSVDQLEKIINIPVLALITEAVKKYSYGVTKKTPYGMNPAVKESFRSLSASLRLLGKAEGARIFLFTSALPSEGKTFCSFHTATQLASQGFKTLLIDADLRKPNLHLFFKSKIQKPGLSEFLAGENTLENCLQETLEDKMLFIPAGSRSPNPPGLLSDKMIEHLIGSTKDHFDYIIFDSAPINAVADTLLLAPHMQHVCLILRAGSTPNYALIRAVQSLEKTVTKSPCGIVFNRYKKRRGLYYYYNYNYHKSYGYDGAYGEGKEGGTS